MNALAYTEVKKNKYNIHLRGSLVGHIFLEDCEYLFSSVEGEELTAYYIHQVAIRLDELNNAAFDKLFTRHFVAKADMATYLTFEFSFIERDYQDAMRKYGSMEEYVKHNVTADEFKEVPNGGEWTYGDVEEVPNH